MINHETIPDLRTLTTLWDIKNHIYPKESKRLDFTDKQILQNFCLSVVSKTDITEKYEKCSGVLNHDDVLYFSDWFGKKDYAMGSPHK